MSFSKVRVGLTALDAQTDGLSMVKMSLDPVQVKSGQVKDLKVSPSSNGDTRGSWDGKEEFDPNRLDLNAKSKPVSVISCLNHSSDCNLLVWTVLQTSLFAPLQLF